METAHGPIVAGGLAQHPSGLWVPEEQKRQREVWTREEWQILERATKLLASREMTLHIGCAEDGCRSKPIERVRNLDGSLTLRCAHKDRIFVRYPK